ncbi:MAG: DUF5658 family protein [Planctomycetota bacterium]
MGRLSPATQSNPFNPPIADRAYVEARTDRRAEPTPRLSVYSLSGGRRRGAQRAGEREGSFVDTYSAWIFLWILWVAAMNVGDSFFTIVHLQAGGVEVNPVAAAMLKAGRFGFVFLKAVVISVALLVLTVHTTSALRESGCGSRPLPIRRWSSTT